MKALMSNNIQNTHKVARNPTASIDGSKEPAFRTQNHHIFPSLHPMSNTYKERINATPVRNPTLNFRGGEQAEPVKKMRQNDSTGMVVTKIETREFLEDSRGSFRNQSQEDFRRKSTSSSSSSSSSDEHVFRVPKLPKRLLLQKKQANKEEVKQFDQKKVDTTKDTFNYDFQSLVMPDPTLAGFSSLNFDKTRVNNNNNNNYNNNIGVTRYTPVTKNFDHAQNQRSNVRSFDAGNLNNNAINMGLDMDPQAINQIYNNLMLQFFTFQLKQNSPSLFQICQQNTQSLLNNINTSVTDLRDRDQGNMILMM